MIVKICIRPLPELGESTEGYFRRLAVENGNLTFSTFIRQLFGKALSCRNLDYAAISHVTGHQTGELSGLQLVKSGNGVFRYNDQPIFGYQVLDVQRYCPECVAEQGYLLARWNIAWLPLCTRHNRRLVPLCGTCVQPLLAGSTDICEKCAGQSCENMEVVERQRKLEEQLENTSAATHNVIKLVEEIHDKRRSVYSNYNLNLLWRGRPRRGLVYFPENGSNTFELAQELYSRLVA